MNLSILCVTNGGDHVLPFVQKMHTAAGYLGAELVLGLDGKHAQKAEWRSLANVAVKLPAHDVPLQEMVMDIAVEACTGEWILRLDDDESASTALLHWLSRVLYQDGMYSFPRVYLYPDAQHALCNRGIYPDLQTRLGRKATMLGVNSIHAGNPNGAGTIVPFAIEHHKLLVKTLAQRQEIADRYEAIRPGAGRSDTYARYNTPEDVYPQLEVRNYHDGDMTGW